MSKKRDRKRQDPPRRPKRQRKAPNRDPLWVPEEKREEYIEPWRDYDKRKKQ